LNIFFAEKVSCRNHIICQIIGRELCRVQNFSRILTIVRDNISEIFVTFPNWNDYCLSVTRSNYAIRVAVNSNRDSW